MKKRKLLFIIAVAGLVAMVGYAAVEKGDWFDQTTKLAEGPKLSEGTKGEGSTSGGQVSGETPKDAENGGSKENPGADPDSVSGESPGDTSEGGSGDGQAAGISKGEDGVIAVIAKPDSVTALVNPYNMLPEDYAPSDLVYPDVRFIFSEKIEKRMLRKEAAEAVEELFAGAEEDGVYLAGVSAYRSHETQKALFDRYVKRDGYDKARTYSALPGTSEHETGLAIDVTSSDGKCAAADCFGETKEADWLKKHAAAYGFIIRYPEGKKEITGYQYEPWHLRYVGVDLASEIASNNETLEEYYDAVPVNG